MASQTSLPSWERGLKYRVAAFARSPTAVAPLVGAWIEIIPKERYDHMVEVAPLVGAWIEMMQIMEK